MATEQSTRSGPHQEVAAILLGEAAGGPAVEQFPIALPGPSGAERAVLLRQEQIDQLAHDLLNPLTVLKALSQRILRGIDRGRPIELGRLAADMHAADEAVTRAVGEIAAFLEVADRSRPVPALEFSPLDFAEVIEEAIADCRQVAVQHRFVVVKEEAALVGLGERGLLLHAFDNILRNAIKYSPHGGTITASLHVEAEQDIRWAVIAVRDEGIGVPAAALPFVFNRFYRAENVSDIPGTGLGLSGALRIAEAHHGAIGVESIEGQGCVITVRLPLESIQASK